MYSIHKPALHEGNGHHQFAGVRHESPAAQVDGELVTDNELFNAAKR